MATYSSQNELLGDLHDCIFCKFSFCVMQLLEGYKYKGMCLNTSYELIINY